MTLSFWIFIHDYPSPLPSVNLFHQISAPSLPSFAYLELCANASPMLDHAPETVIAIAYHWVNPSSNQRADAKKKWTSQILKATSMKSAIVLSLPHSNQWYSDWKH